MKSQELCETSTTADQERDGQAGGQEYDSILFDLRATIEFFIKVFK